MISPLPACFSLENCRRRQATSVLASLSHSSPLRGSFDQATYFPCDLSSISPLLNMSRGNQREVDRQRAQARNSKKGGKARDDRLTPEQRRERDAKALQEKAARKAAQAATAGGGNVGERKHSDSLIDGVPEVPKGQRSNISVTIEGEVAQMREHYWCYNKAV